MRRVCVPLRRTRALRAVLLAAFAALALTVVPSSFGIVYIEGVTNDQLPDFDASADLELAPTDAQTRAAYSLGANVTWNSYGTPATIFNPSGYVATGIKAPSAAAAARSWLRSNRPLFGIPSTANLRLVTQEPLRGARTDHAVVFRQSFGGALSDGQVALSIVGTAKTGWKIIYVSSSLNRGPAQLEGRYRLTPLAAWTTAAGFAGHHVSERQVTTFGKTPNGSTEVIATGFMGQQAVHPVAFPTKYGMVRAYKATVQASTDGDQSAYDVVVDATTGKLLSRQNLVFNAVDNPTWLAPRHSMPYNPMNAYPWNYPTTDGRSAFCWTATAGCTVVVGDNPATNTYPMGVASKLPWDVQPDAVTGANLGTTATIGNNVDDARVWSGSHGVYGNAALLRATSATRDYQPAFTDAWYTSGCNPANVNAATNPTGNDIEASTVSLFVGHNVMHDWAYYLGFDEGHWNAQQYNNGVTTNDTTPTPGGPTIAAPLGNDGLIGNAQSGAATREPRQREHGHRRRRPRTRRRTSSSGSRSPARSTPRAWTAPTTSRSSATSSAT